MTYDRVCSTCADAVAARRSRRDAAETPGLRERRALRKQAQSLRRPGAGDDELLDALNSAQLLNFVTGLPDGLDTWIGESAKLLSGGQARRVAVARAIASRPALVLADEPTANVDRGNQQQIIDLIRETCREERVALLLVTTYLLARVAGRIYRMGILMKGKRPNLPEFARWLRHG